MPEESPVQFIPLNPAVHDRQGFSCGEPSLDTYLQRQATQDIKSRAAAAYVMTRVEEPARILGYYTLAATSVQLEGIPETKRKKLPRYPDVAASLIGRLALAGDLKGQKLGGRLLGDALGRILAQSQEMGIAVVVVDALNDNARDFYLHYGFIPFGHSENRLFLPVETLAKATT